MYLKHGVRFSGIKPCTVLAICLCEQVFRDAGQRFTITSVCEGKHSKGSFHYSGFAFDIRIFDLRGVTPYTIASRLKEALGDEFDVVCEQDHIHVECDTNV